MKSNICIDGIVFSLQRAGGISVYFKTLIDYLLKIELPAKILLDEPLMQGVDENSNFNKIAVKKSARFGERYRSCRTPNSASVFHSSYYRLSNQPTIPSVVTVYDFIYERYQRGPRQWAHTFQKNASIRAAQSIICISQSTKDDLLEFVGITAEQKIEVIHCGVADTFRCLHLEPAAKPYLLFVGQRAGYKNFSQLLKAMVFLPELELLCVGGGAIHHSELAGMPESVIVRVRHLGFVTDEELNIFYNRAVCLVYPSSYEGFGIPVVEAMRAGCPVVSTDCKAVLEVGKEALTVVSDIDPRAMADAILKTASSERANLIKIGLVIAHGYSWESTHRHTVEVYRSLGG